MATLRCPENPVIRPKDIPPLRTDFEVIGTFNPAVTRFNDEIILLLRVAQRPINPHPDFELVPIYNAQSNEIEIKEISRDCPDSNFDDPRIIYAANEVFLTSISYLQVARSKDGINFDIDTSEVLFPANNYETFGLEDARITCINNEYYITYIAVSPMGVVTCLAKTNDFKNFERLGVISCPDNKDVVLFPEKIKGSYYAITRPVTSLFSKYDMWIAKSPDLLFWGQHKYLLGADQKSWDNIKVGAGAVPFKTDQGWLEIYHAADKENCYSLGALLLDINDPSRVLAKSKKPILKPQADYELEGFFGNAVFSCGCLKEKEKIIIYYGAADKYTARAEVPLKDCFDSF